MGEEVPSTSAVGSKFDVGGVLLDQPFKIRRLGHVGINMDSQEDGLRFYRELLGFRIADERDDFANAKFDLPAEFNRSIGLDKATLYVTGKNLFTFTRYEGMDPELDTQRAVPLQKEYIIGIEILYILMQLTILFQSSINILNCSP